jgi:dolichol-phosphate mannosyltransferase
MGEDSTSKISDDATAVEIDQKTPPKSPQFDLITVQFMPFRCLTALPVFNEVQYVGQVLDEVARYSHEVLVVDDGSNDGTAERLASHRELRLVTHRENRGYGAALRTAFCYAVQNDFDFIVTIDCDGQHEPQRIPEFVTACRDVDIVSGSRYLQQFAGDNDPPSDRRWVNQQITAELNERLSLQLTDAFCGFKAYRVEALEKLRLTEDGYAMPLELWVQAAHHRLRLVERPVPLIYLDEARSFGGVLDDTATRLNHYQAVLEQSVRAVGDATYMTAPLCGDDAG